MGVVALCPDWLCGGGGCPGDSGTGPDSGEQCLGLCWHMYVCLLFRRVLQC